MQETQVWSLGWDDLLEKEMATHSSTLAWKIPLMEEPGGLQFVGSQKVGHDQVTSLFFSLVQVFVVYGLLPTRLLCLWNFQGKNTRMRCHFLLGIFLTQAPGIKPTFLASPALAGGFFITSAIWEAQKVIMEYINKLVVISSCGVRRKPVEIFVGTNEPYLAGSADHIEC